MTYEQFFWEAEKVIRLIRDKLEIPENYYTVDIELRDGHVQFSACLLLAKGKYLRSSANNGQQVIKELEEFFMNENYDTQMVKYFDAQIASTELTIKALTENRKKYAYDTNS